ncbi:MAG TPA: hypothetical protein VGG19_07850 [Tepidisphaeraceae bacterium]|jgi:hypothetical protein
MTDAAAETFQLASQLETGAAYTGPLDAAIEYLRIRIGFILPIYVLAMIPHAIVIAWLIDAITAEQRSLMPRLCIYLCIATIWRWIGLAWIQQQAQRDLQLRPGRPLAKQLLPILLVRLFSNAVMSWGIFGAGIPSFYAIFSGSFATPLMLDDSIPERDRLKNGLRGIHRSARRLLRISLPMLVLMLWLVAVIGVTQYFLIGFVLPHLFDVQLTEVEVTQGSSAWWLGMIYFAFLILDMFWAVASVMIYYDSQSRRMGTDLYARLAGLDRGMQ